MNREICPVESFVVSEISECELPMRFPDKTVWYFSTPKMISCWSNAKGGIGETLDSAIKKDVKYKRGLKKSILRGNSYLAFSIDYIYMSF